VRYWDTSALVPLVVRESASDLVRRWLDQDAGVVTWAWTRVEFAGAIERRVRDGAISRDQRRDHLARLETLARNWDEVMDLVAVRSKALGLLARHDLRAADAAHLAAALIAAQEDPSTLPFVCFDDRLAEAAEREGLRVLS
jgi:hypothetical protein